jgi:hypothetical protein
LAQTGPLSEPPRRPRLERSVANGDAGDVGALQCPADLLGLVPLEAGEAGTEQLANVLGNDRLGERIGLVEQAAGLVAGEIDTGAGFAFAFETADLDDPAGAGVDDPAGVGDP